MLVLALSSIGAAQARASTASEVETLIQEGIELRRAGYDGRAITVFQRGYDLERTPRTAGQLGLCELALGYWLDAEGHLDEALASPGHPWVKRNRRELQGAIENTRNNLGEVIVMSSPDRGDLLVDGRRAGQLPLPRPLRLSKGVHEIALRLEGYKSATRSVAVAGRDRQSIEIGQQSVSAAAATSPSASASAAAPPAAPAAQETTLARSEPAPSLSRDASGVQTAPPTADEARSTSHRRLVAWGTAGLAAAALGFGAFETTTWIGKVHEFDDHTGPLVSNPALTGNNCASSASNSGGAGCNAIHDALASARTLALVGYGAGAALGGLAVYLFLTSPPAEAPAQTALACAPDLGSAGLSCIVSF